MKTTIKILAICCLNVLMLGACSLHVIDEIESILNSSSISESKDLDNQESEDLNYQESEDLDYQKACEELDFAKAHQILKKLRDEYVNEGLPNTYYCLVTNIKGYQAYVDADIYIFREEATYLLGLDDPAAEARILKMIMETPLDGNKLEEGPCGYDEADELSVSGGEKNWLYSYCIKRYNQKCDIVMDLAVLYGNKTLAKKVLTIYKDNMHIEQSTYAGNNTRTIHGKTMEIKGGYIWYDSSDKDAAQKRYNEAVKNGMFNN